MDEIEQYGVGEGSEISDFSVFNRLGFSILALMGIQWVAVILAAALVSLYAPQLQQTGWYIWVLNYVPLYLLAFPVTLLILRSVPSREGNTPAPMHIPPGKLVALGIACLGIVYPLNLLATLVSTLLEALFGAGFVNPLAGVVLQSNPWVNLFFAVLVAPVMEEILFRHLLYKKLIAYGGKVYVLFSAFLFALMHANLYQLAYAFALGILFASVVYFTGTIRYSIALHMAINFIGSGMAPFLLAYGNEMIMGIWGLLILALMIAGIIVCIRWWRTKRGGYAFLPGTIPLPRKRIMFLNPGVGIYAVVVLCIILASIFL